MTGASHSPRNTVKNVSLVLLVALLCVLSAANWLTAFDVTQMAADHPLRQIYDRASGGATGYAIRSSGIAAAEPAQLALFVDGGLRAVQYSPSEVDAALEAVRTLWSEALSGEDELREVTEDALLQALAAGDCALLRYHGAVPLCAAAGWLGGTRQEEVAVNMLLYSAPEGKLYIRDGAGTLYACAARADAGTLQRAREGFSGQAAAFAGDQYAVYPETLLFDNEVLSFEVLRPAALHLLASTKKADATLQTLLGAFGYTPYARSYGEQGGESRVFVDDVTTLRIEAGGRLQYSAPAEGGTLLAYDRGEAEGAGALEAQLDCARSVLDSALHAVGAKTRAALYAVSRNNDTTVLTFLQTYSGVPIFGEQDFATFLFQDGVLVSATVHLELYDALAVRQAVMPALQAAVSASGQPRRLTVAYRAQGTDYIPARYFIG